MYFFKNIENNLIYQYELYSNNFKYLEYPVVVYSLECSLKSTLYSSFLVLTKLFEQVMRTGKDANIDGFQIRTQTIVYL